MTRRQDMDVALIDTLCTLHGIDREIRRITGAAAQSRPFLCRGSPLGCEVAEVGINPRTDTPF
jgi:hypothetical protein